MSRSRKIRHCKRKSHRCSYCRTEEPRSPRHSDKKRLAASDPTIPDIDYREIEAYAPCDGFPDCEVCGNGKSVAD